MILQKNNKDTNEQMMVSVASEKAEAIGGILVAFFAALMAIADLTNNNIEEAMRDAQNKNASYFSWYQSKSVKQSLQESHLATLQVFLNSGIIKPDKEIAIKEEIEKVKADIKRYKAEKKEILEGSANIPQNEWVQDLDGKMGNIVGVKEWERLVNKLDKATNKFDMAMLFFQISLVLGAVCIVIHDNPKLQRKFTLAMIVIGIIGIALSIYGYILGQ